MTESTLNVLAIAGSMNRKSVTRIVINHVAEKMRGLKLANVRVINLLGGAMAINYGEKSK